MSKFYSLFSSSKGNASFLGSSKSGILVDTGVSCRKLETALYERGIAPEAVQGIFITHSHSDHVAGLRVFLKKHPVPVYATEKTLSELRRSTAIAPSLPCHVIEPGEPVEVAEMRLTAFSTMHDAQGSCGYRVTMPDGQSCGVCTDLGMVTPEVEAGVFGADLVLLEANYDPDLLRRGPYPPYLQQRIRGEYGHLSNQDSAAMAQKLVEHGTTRLILGHLSENNNTMSLAKETVLSYLEEKGIRENRDFLMEVSTPTGLEQAVIF